MGGEKGILKGSFLIHKKGGTTTAAATTKIDVPKGCLAIKVGGEGEEQQRVIVPVVYLSHPLFLKLLKEAEEEYGFHHNGTITIPCHVAEFRYVQGMIDREKSLHHHHHHHHHDRYHRPIAGCFRA